MMSMGFLINDDTPVVWRGLMVQNALNQLLFDVIWPHHDGPLDYLIIDTPPGTGDVHLTLAQKLVIDGAVIVTTSQDVALIDATKAIAMFGKMDVPVLGVIENMAGVVCPHCAHDIDLFGNSGLKDFLIKNNCDYLGAVPFDRNLKESCDQGAPLSVPYYDIAIDKVVKGS
jgi:ATP-binding protein involved in chromosome partitioning